MSIEPKPSCDVAHSPVDSDGFSPAAVAEMRAALAVGEGRMAQFDHPELGGAGQWMRNGMLMIAEMGNDALRVRVARLCERLASGDVQDVDRPRTTNASFQHQDQAAAGATRVQESQWPDAGWPPELGAPDTSGAQNGMRYAWFAGARRLIVDDQGHRAQYDTGDHRISGVSQRQGDGGHLVFSSQHGPIDLRSLPAAGQRFADPQPVRRPGSSAPDTHASVHDPFTAIERLADLHARGIVDAAEFAAKKAELLQRI